MKLWVYDYVVRGKNALTLRAGLLVGQHRYRITQSELMSMKKSHCRGDSSNRHCDQTEGSPSARPEAAALVVSVTLRSRLLSTGTRKGNRPRSSARDKGCRKRSSTTRLWPDRSSTAMEISTPWRSAFARVSFLGDAKVTRERRGVLRNFHHDLAGGAHEQAGVP